MPHPLYLTAEEQSLFDALPGGAKEGWTVTPETQTYQDTDRQRRIRREFMKLTDKKLLDFQKKARAAKTQEEFNALAAKIDLSHVSESDLRELFFALGPDGMSFIVTGILKEAKTDDDIETAAAFSALRHTLLEAMLSAA